MTWVGMRRKRSGPKAIVYVRLVKRRPHTVVT
jgi:hypothetical protein